MPSIIKKVVLTFLVCGFFTTSIHFACSPIRNWLFEKGIEAKTSWKLEKAISYFSWASYLNVKKDETLYEKALCLQLQGEFDLSQKELSKLTVSQFDPELTVKYLNTSGINSFNQNKADEALNLHEQALEIAEQTNNRALIANTLINQSRVLYHTKGRFSEAQIQLEKALTIGRDLNNETIIADTLRNIGVVLWWGKGELDIPLRDYYEPALALYRKNQNYKGEATMLSNISLIYSAKGDIFRFMKLQNESLSIREKIGDRAGLSESYKSLGSAYLGVRNLRKAREYFIDSVKISKKIGFRLNQNEAEVHLAGLNVELGDYDYAIDLMQKILEREKDNPELVKLRLATIGNCYLLKGDFENARSYLEKVLAMELANRPEDKEKSLLAIYTYLGETYLRLGELEKAKAALDKSAVEFSKFDSVNGHLTYHIAQAELKFEEKDFEKSFEYLNQAAENESLLFSASGTNVVALPFAKDYDRVFSLLLEKLNRELFTKDGKNGRAEALAFRFLEQRRNRSFRNFIVQSGSKRISSTQAGHTETSALANVQNISEELKFRDSAAGRERLQLAYSKFEDAVVKEQFSSEMQRAIRAVRPVDLKTAQEELSENTAAIEYIFAGEKTFALVITKNSLQSFALPVTRANVENKVKLLQQTFFSEAEGEEEDLWRPISQSLRSSLIEPIESSHVLKNIERLAIVPSGILHDLPFAALAKTDGLQTRFLIEDFVIFIPPSISFLAGSEPSKNRRNLVSFGRNSVFPNDLPPLKFAVEESQVVANIFSGTAKTENEATETSFKKLAGGASHLHIAAHSITEPEMPLFSRLLLTATDSDDGNLTTREIFELGIDADLVTIAACEGAKGYLADYQQLAEIDRTGLTEAFLHAGSNSVLAIISPASDHATTELMKDFYKNLLSNDKATSLALSQRSMLRGEIDPQFKRPEYWANFVLIGTDR